MRPTTCNESQAIEIALYTQSQLDAAVAVERKRWEKPAVLWPVVMPDEVRIWLQSHMPKVVPIDLIQRVDYSRERNKE